MENTEQTFGHQPNNISFELERNENGQFFLSFLFNFPRCIHHNTGEWGLWEAEEWFNGDLVLTVFWRRYDTLFIVCWQSSASYFLAGRVCLPWEKLKRPKYWTGTFFNYRFSSPVDKGLYQIVLFFLFRKLW